VVLRNVFILERKKGVDMPNVVALNGTVLARGGDLAVVLRYARRYPVEVIRVDLSVEHREQYAVTFYFDPERHQGHCLTYWGDWRVLLDWLMARRSWTALHRIRFAHSETFDLAHVDVRTAKLRARGVTVCGPAGK
jgi:hypothetical protein